MKKIISALIGCVLMINAFIIPTSASAQTLSSDTKEYYNNWKETYLRQNPYVTDETQYYVFYGEEEYAQAHKTVEVTVSEAHGYGMLITVLMSDYDSEAKDIFDGMYHYYLAHTSSIGPHLMAWQQSDNGKALVDPNGADSATDGDLDIAYALLADKIWGSSGEWIPAPANFLENENDGVYEYNFCRVPWRISTDALVGKNADAKKYAETVNAFFVKETGSDPQKIVAGYTPDGKAVADWDDLCFTAPLMLSAAAAGDAKWHDAVRREVLDIGVDSYFGNTIAMLCLITDDGGWLVPNTTTAKPTGDVNGDGEFNAADAVLLQKWLIGVPDIELANWKAADYNADDKLNIMDLCLMKRELIRSALYVNSVL